ncbi:MAG TPA: hypothetical protein VGH28_04665 [Polyangiaceae bacterium]|jgi:MYXO-CTERM domain-containing protein
MRRFIAFAVASLPLFVASRARATAEFPGQIVSDQNITCANPLFDGNGCTICHQDDNGGLGTATRPFGRYMKSQGLTPFNDQKLGALLTALQNESPHTTDTNCDGTPDIDELTSCQWQNLTQDMCGADAGGVDGGSVPLTVFYGCSTSPTVGDRDTPILPGGAAVAIAGMLGAALIRAKRRKR